MSAANNGIEENLNLVLEDANLQEIAVDFGDIALDTLFDESVLKDVPVLGVLVKVISARATIADKLFLRKLLSFLFHLRDIPPKDRAAMIRRIDESQEYRTRVGEKLLFIINSCEDYEIAELIGRVFRHFLQGKINYRQFLKTSSVLQRLNMSDFKWFTCEKEHKYFDLSNTGNLMHTGLFELYYRDVKVDIIDKFDDGIVPREARLEAATEAERKILYETDVDGGVDVNLSEAGEIIMEIFNPKFKQMT